MGKQNAEVQLYAFGILAHDGEDLRGLRHSREAALPRQCP